MDRSFQVEELLQQAGWLRGLAASLVGDPGQADDLVQETWLAALRRPPQSGASPRPWLERVLRNLARNRGRAERTRRDHERHAGEPGPPAGPDAIAAEVEAQRLLAEAVGRLGEPGRTIVVLRYFRGLDSAAIGRELALPAGTVRWKLQGALEELRRELDRRCEGGRRAWSVLLGRLAATGAPAATIGPWVALAAGGLAVVAGWWWLARPARVESEGERVRAGAAVDGAVELVRAAVAEEPHAETVIESQRSLVALADLPESAPVAADIEGRVLVDGAEPGRPIALEIRFLAQRDHPPASGPAVPGSGRLLPRRDVRKLLTGADGRFEVFAIGAESSFRVVAPGFLPEAGEEPRGETPARGLVLHLLTPPTLRGRIVTSAREPVRGTVGQYWLQADFEGWQMFSGPGDVDCDEEGRFAIPLVDLMGEGVPAECSAQLLIEVARVGRLHVDTGPVPFADRDLATLVLEPVRGLRFRVRDERGQPLAGAVARLDDVWLSKPSSPTNGQGWGELRHTPQGCVRVRFSALGYVDRILRVAVEDEPDVWLAPSTVLEVQLERPAGLDGPFPSLVLTASEELLPDDEPQAPVPFLLDRNWLQAELGASRVHSWDTRNDGNGRLHRLYFLPDGGGLVRIAGLRPDVPLAVEARDDTGTLLTRCELVLAPGEHRRLTLRYGD